MILTTLREFDHVSIGVIDTKFPVQDPLFTQEQLRSRFMGFVLGKRVYLAPRSVSYTHLTLPTIYSV